jgi:dihydrofolate reductase
MRKVIVFNMITLDGYFAGPNGDIDWHSVDEEFNQFAIAQLNEVGALLFGRVTYELMAGYWPTPAAAADDTEVANLMNQLPKFVFSRTLDRAGWQNTQLVKTGAADQVASLKQQPGSDLFIFGSGKLVASLIQDGLIDEFRLIVSPLVLGRGQPMFADLQKPLKLKLEKTRTFKNGNVLLYYQVEQ